MYIIAVPVVISAGSEKAEGFTTKICTLKFFVMVWTDGWGFVLHQDDWNSSLKVDDISVYAF